MNSTLAPVILFVYNRPDHTLRTLQSLEAAQLAESSELFIFSDGAKTDAVVEAVNQVKEIIRRPWQFKQVHIIERDHNWGLAANIIDGVGRIIQQYGRVIVLEDDLEVSPYALTYFNDALQRYEQEEQVMEISGYMYPVDAAEKLDETFFFRVANSWGWATWQRAWQHFNPDIEKLTAEMTPADIKRFTIDHSENFWRQVQQFKAGKINSWAIRWYLSIFNQNGLVLYPRTSFIQNIGTDGTGTHSDVDRAYTVQLAQSKVSNFPKKIEENRPAYEAIRYFYRHRKGSLWNRAVRFAKKKLG